MLAFLPYGPGEIVMHRRIVTVKFQCFFKFLNGPVVIPVQIVDLAQGDERRGCQWIQFYRTQRWPDRLVKTPCLTVKPGKVQQCIDTIWIQLQRLEILSFRTYRIEAQVIVHTAQGNMGFGQAVVQLHSGCRGRSGSRVDIQGLQIFKKRTILQTQRHLGVRSSVLRIQVHRFLQQGNSLLHFLGAPVVTKISPLEVKFINFRDYRA